jgi:hypothetical protein
MASLPAHVEIPAPEPAASLTTGAATISQAHIDRLRRALADYSARLERRVDGCRDEYAERAAAVLDYLSKTAAASKPRKVGLFLYLTRPRSPLEWVRFDPDVNSTLMEFAKARGITLTARHHPVPRDQRFRASRAKGMFPEVYEWGWRYEDFRRRGVSAQPWEATLAADYETAVAAPLRRALRAARMASNFLGELRPVEDIQLDLAAAEAFLVEKLRLPYTAGDGLSDQWTPNLSGPRPRVLADGDPMLWQGLLARLLEALEARLKACATEYTVAAARLRDRLDPDSARQWQGPGLAPRVLTPAWAIADPIVVWQAAKPGRLSDPADPVAAGWRNLTWNSTADRAKYRSYAASRSARRQSPVPAHEFYWFTEAPRLLKDFEPAQMWERWFALYYDRTVVTPLRRQWLLARWALHLQSALVDPDACRLQLNLEKYLPHVL